METAKPFLDKSYDASKNCPIFFICYYLEF